MAILLYAYSTLFRGRIVSIGDRKGIMLPDCWWISEVLGKKLLKCARTQKLTEFDKSVFIRPCHRVLISSSIPVKYRYRRYNTN
jgi:hypothetical protein